MHFSVIIYCLILPNRWDFIESVRKGASKSEVNDIRDRKVPRKWRYRQQLPVEREKQMTETGDWESEEERISKSKPYAGWISSIVPNSNQLAALGLSIKINIFSIATSYTGLLVIKDLTYALQPHTGLTASCRNKFRDMEEQKKNKEPRCMRCNEIIVSFGRTYCVVLNCFHVTCLLHTCLFLFTLLILHKDEAFWNNYSRPLKMSHFLASLL